MVPTVLRGAAALALLGALLPATSAAETRGSSLAGAPVDFGCETVYQPRPASPDTTYAPNPSGFDSCTWYYAGRGGGLGTIADSSLAPLGSGTITKVRVRSGPNPAKLSIVMLKTLYLVDSSGAAYDHQCCTATAESEIFSPTPNAVTEIPVNLPYMTQLGEYQKKPGISNNVAVSGHGPGTLPITSTGTHDAFSNGPSSAAYFPAIRKDVNNPNNQNAPDFEVLLQFDSCQTAAARQACATPGAPTPAPAPTPGVMTPPAPTAPVRAGEIRSTKLTLSGIRVPVGVRCDTPTGAQCSGSVRLRTRGGKRTFLLASRRLTMNDGQTATVQLALGRTARKRVARRTNKVTVEVDFGTAGKTTKALNLRRRK